MNGNGDPFAPPNERWRTLFDSIWTRALLVVVFAAVGPFAAGRIGVGGRTLTGWSILVVGGLVSVGLLLGLVFFFEWLGRIEALGAIEPSRKRMAAAIALAAATLVGTGTLLMWLFGPTTSAGAARTFLAKHFAMY